jgi:tRNA dimethylallyltransferase
VTAKPGILVVVGPTASGKTAVGVELAHLLHGEIISADSRQVYRYLDIGTAKLTTEERREIPHHFLDRFPPEREYCAGDFGVEGREVVLEILARKHLPIVVGGSGLYIQSLIDGFFEELGADREYRSILEERLVRQGLQPLVDELRVHDPEGASKIDTANPRRVVRALEILHVTGKPLSVLQREKKPSIPFVPVLFGLDVPRAVLYRRINDRCDQMLSRGLLREVEELEKRGYTDALNALNTVGYKEAFACRRGEISYEEMVRLFKQNSRHYAKRQMTWFRRDQRIRWILMAGGKSAAVAAREIMTAFRHAGEREVAFETNSL